MCLCLKSGVWSVHECWSSVCSHCSWGLWRGPALPSAAAPWAPARPDSLRSPAGPAQTTRTPVKPSNPYGCPSSRDLWTFLSSCWFTRTSCCTGSGSFHALVVVFVVLPPQWGQAKIPGRAACEPLKTSRHVHTQETMKHDTWQQGVQGWQFDAQW